MREASTGRKAEVFGGDFFYVHIARPAVAAVGPPSMKIIV
jgi:hypothetical protein